MTVQTSTPACRRLGARFTRAHKLESHRRFVLLCGLCGLYVHVVKARTEYLLHTGLQRRARKRDPSPPFSLWPRGAPGLARGFRVLPPPDCASSGFAHLLGTVYCTPHEALTRAEGIVENCNPACWNLELGWSLPRRPSRLTST